MVNDRSAVDIDTSHTVRRVVRVSGLCLWRNSEHSCVEHKLCWNTIIATDSDHSIGRSI